VEGLGEDDLALRLSLHQPYPSSRRDTVVQTFTIRDLRKQTDKIVREAKSGRLSVVTKDGEPIFIAVPFDDSLLRGGLATTLATRLFDDGAISLGQAAQLARIDVTGFMEVLSRLKIPVARPRRGELEQELEAFG
jgi:antitoxin (DNA-binding transcriptional repressor) of toxin-antitoxin stability system